MDLLVLIGAVALAWLAWKRPGRSSCSDICDNLGKVSRRRKTLR